MPVSFIPSGEDYIRFLPEMIMTAVGTFMMILEALLGDEYEGKGKIFGHLSLATLLAAMLAAIFANGYQGTAFSSLMIVDGYASFFRVLVIGVGMLTVLCSYQYLTREKAQAGEYHALILFSIVGQCVMVTANEMMMV